MEFFLTNLYIMAKGYAERPDISSKLGDFPKLFDQLRYNLPNLYADALRSFNRSEYKEEFSKIEEELEKIFPSTIPEIGNAIVGYKLVLVDYDEEAIDINGEAITVIHRNIPGLAKLYIPSDAKRLQSFNNKCRCDRAIVTDIRAKIGNKVFRVKTGYSPAVIAKKFFYNVDEYVFPDSYDDNRFNECSHGIHFFMTQDEAIDYALKHYLPIYVSNMDGNMFEGLYEGD